MNRRIKKKINKRGGFFHYKNYKDNVRNSWYWYGQQEGCWHQGSMANDYNIMGIPRHIYVSHSSPWFYGIPFSGIALPPA